jgi:hypothetical protein
MSGALYLPMTDERCWWSDGCGGGSVDVPKDGV